MTIKEAIGVKTNERIPHREIYRRAIEYLGGLDVVLPYVPFPLKSIQKAIETGDEYLNTLPLKIWDAASGFYTQGWDCFPTHDGITILLRQKSINVCSCSESVCILKEAALEWTERGF